MLKQCARALTAMTLVLAGAAAAAPPAGFDQRVEALRKQIGVPGVSITIVEDGKVTLARGWGVKDITTNQPVDADTIFFTGSTGKAFTNAALATLVDEGKIKWDDKVIDHMLSIDRRVGRNQASCPLLAHSFGAGTPMSAYGDGRTHPGSDVSSANVALKSKSTAMHHQTFG